MTQKHDGLANLAEIERAAVELAALAGTEISMALGGLLTVRYKGAGETDEVWRDPVSEVDQRVEQIIRERISRRFPDHGVIGEEFEGEQFEGETVWAVDPIDGTANFVNGFPLFAAAVGVIHQGRPVAGAIWCATGHALRSGVYHGRLGGGLKFDESAVEPKEDPQVRRRLVGVPEVGVPEVGGRKLRWDTRKTGSAAIECAFVAAGLLEAARFDTPNIWDVASGIMLVQASGAKALVRDGDAWRPFESFAEEGADMRNWSRPLIIGRLSEEELIEELG